MGKNRVVETIPPEGVQVACVLRQIDRPVLPQLLGAQDQNPVISKFEVLDDGERRIGLTEADAIRQDAAVVGVDLIDGALHAVALKVEQRLPDSGLGDSTWRKSRSSSARSDTNFSKT